MPTNCLNTLTDSELIVLIKESADSDAFKEACRRFENLFYKICQKYAARLTAAGLNVQDIFDERDFLILGCIKSYNPTKKAKLSTWIANYARYFCLNSITARKFLFPSHDEEIHNFIEESQVKKIDFGHGEIQVKKDDMDIIMKIIDDIEDKRISQILNYRYLGDKKVIWADVANKMNISSQTAINLHNKGLTVLRSKMSHEKLANFT